MVGGERHTVSGRAGLVVGNSNTMAHNNSSIIAGTGLSTTAANTAYTQNLTAFGNVGIGTATPTMKFDVTATTSGNIAGFYPTVGNANSAVIVGTPRGGAGLQLFSNTGYRWDLTTANEILTMGNATGGQLYMPAASANVGINVSAPTKTLDVNGEARVRTLPAGTDTDAVVTADADGNLRKVAAGELGKLSEPWFGTDDNAAATDNTEDIYTMGGVGIGTSNLNPYGNGNQDLTIADANGDGAAQAVAMEGDLYARILSNGTNSIAQALHTTSGALAQIQADATSGTLRLKDNAASTSSILYGYQGMFGVNQVVPEAVFDINGDARIRTLPAGTDTDEIVTADANGNLRKVNSLKASRVFYPPSVAIDASTNGTFTVDLYQQYVDQYGSPVVSSEASAIPTYGRTELAYHVTYADPTVFGDGTTVQNMSIDTNGVLSYEVFSQPATSDALINIVFVVK